VSLKANECPICFQFVLHQQKDWNTIEDRSAHMRYFAFRYNSSFDPIVDTLNSIAGDYGCSKARMTRICLTWILADEKRRAALIGSLNQFRPC